MMMNRSNVVVSWTPITRLILVLALFGATAAGVVVGTQFGDLRWGLDDSLGLMFVTIISSAILLIGFTTNRIDRFSPLVMFALAFLIQYSIPGFLLVTASNSEVRSGVPFYYFGRAMTAVVIALLGSIVGYYVSQQQAQQHGSSKLDRVLTAIQEVPTRYAFSVIMGILGASIGLFIAWIIIGGVPLSLLNALDDESGYGAAARSARVNLVFLLKSHRSWPLLFFLALPLLPNQRWRVPMLILGTFIFLVELGTGSRTAPLVFLILMVLVFYLGRNRRPSIVLLILGLFSLVLISGTLVLVRSPNEVDITVSTVINDARRELLDRGPTYGLMDAIYVFPDRHRFLGIRFFRDILLMPVPRALWPGKPILSSQNAIIEPLLPVADSHSAGLVGVYYAHFGLIGVFFSFLIYSYLFGWIYSAYKRQPADRIRQLLLAGTLPSIYILMIRSNPTAQLTYMAYFFGPVVVSLAIIYRKAIRQRRFGARG